MDEDLELNRLVKSALEAPPPFAWNPSAATCSRADVAASDPVGFFRRPLPWAAASLLAASVALVITLVLPGRDETSPIDEALRLLSEAEGLELENGDAASSADLLVAWQGVMGSGGAIPQVRPSH